MNISKYLIEKDDTPESIVEALEADGFLSLNDYCNSKNILLDILQSMPSIYTIIAEDRYVDKYYRNMYYNFLSSKHFSINRDCVRLSFFKKHWEWEDLEKPDAKKKRLLEKNAIGFTVIRPLDFGAIGRTYFNPYMLKGFKAYVRTTRVKFQVLGCEFTIPSFQYSEQDMQIFSCAETSLSNALDYFSQRYPEYKTTLPSEIRDIAENFKQDRTYPSTGMDFVEISNVLKATGFSPRFYFINPRNITEEQWKRYSKIIKRQIYYYLESAIPVIVGIQGETYSGRSAGHAVNLIGHTKKYAFNSEPLEYLDDNEHLPFYDTADFYNSFVVMDDNQAPFQLRDYDELGSEHSFQKGSQKVIGFVVPLYSRALIEAMDARSIGITALLTIFKLIPMPDDLQVNKENPLVVRLFLTTSRNFKAHHIQHNTTQMANNYALLEMPKLIWVMELTTLALYKNNKAVIGELIIDATGDRDSYHTTLISAHCLDHFGYRQKDEDYDVLYKRLAYNSDPSLRGNCPQYTNNLQ